MLSLFVLVALNVIIFFHLNVTTATLFLRLCALVFAAHSITLIVRDFWLLLFRARIIILSCFDSFVILCRIICAKERHTFRFIELGGQVQGLNIYASVELKTLYIVVLMLVRMSLVMDLIIVWNLWNTTLVAYVDLFKRLSSRRLGPSHRLIPLVCSVCHLRIIRIHKVSSSFLWPLPMTQIHI